jgi:aryl-alcohol dehydrogenase-like predicted oxidoreductase
MRTRPLTADRLVSELGLGTWGLSGDGYGPVSEAVQDEVIERARAYGVTLFETADVYGGGAMERRLGRIVGSDRVVTIVTKVGTDLSSSPARKRFERQYLRDACERSADRLGRGCLDVVLLHNPAASTLASTEATGALAELAAEKNIAAWGVSAGSSEVARAALERGAQVLELAYNVFSHSDLETLELGAGRVGVLARSVLSHGLLCALRFVLANPVVSSAVIGPRNRVQLDQLVREAGTGTVYLAPGLIQRVKNQLGPQP